MSLSERVAQMVIISNLMDHALNGHDSWAIVIDDDTYMAQVEFDDERLSFYVCGVHNQTNTVNPTILRNFVEIFAFPEMSVPLDVGDFRLSFTAGANVG